MATSDDLPTSDWERFERCIATMLLPPPDLAVDLDALPASSPAEMRSALEAAKDRRLRYLWLTAQLIAELERNQHLAVEELRDDLDARWREVAEALGVSNSAVQQRFRKLEVEPEDEGSLLDDIPGIMASLEESRRPMVLAKDGVISWEQAARMRGYPSVHEYRRSSDNDYEEYDRLDYHRELGTAVFRLVVLVFAEVVVYGKSDRAPGAEDKWEGLSEDTRARYWESIDEGNGRFGTDSEFTTSRIRELVEEYDQMRQWLAGTSVRLRQDTGQEPAELAKLRENLGVTDDGVVIQDFVHTI